MAQKSRPQPIPQPQGLRLFMGDAERGQEAIRKEIEAFLRQIDRRAHAVLSRDNIIVHEGRFLKKSDVGKVGAAEATELSLAGGFARSTLINAQFVRQFMAQGDVDNAVLYAIRSVNALWIAEGGDALKENAKKGAARRLALDKDGKQAAKAEVYEFWKERYNGLHPQYRTDEQFAAKVLGLWPVLKSIGTVRGWCTKWNKDMKRRTGSPTS